MGRLLLTGGRGRRRQLGRIVPKHRVRPSATTPWRCPCRERKLCVTNLSPIFARSNSETAWSRRAELGTDAISEICRYNPEITNGNPNGPDPASDQGGRPRPVRFTLFHPSLA